MKQVNLNNVTISYDKHPAIHHISGNFASGSLTAITGPNGAGKSTLLKAIAGILPVSEGEINHDINHDKIAYLPQASELERDFPLSVLDMVSTGFWNKSGGFKTITRTMRDDAINTLSAVGLRGFEKRNISSLSVGQFQRALFARLLVQDADLILLDEPFAAIDTDTTIHLLEIIKNWHKKKRTVICVLHDLEQIRKHFPDCILLARECVSWDHTHKSLHPEKLLKARFFREYWNPEAPVCDKL